jgi:6-pyruvoyltetrahydropterin/6-carboxytetrahydropterin synthase
MKFQSIKRYGHEQGLSCCFRQWRAKSHCSKLHGYALAITIVFEADALDSRNWVVDFGALKQMKAWLQEQFDHTTVVAQDDPERAELTKLHLAGVIDMRIVRATGCEAFAQMIFEKLQGWLPLYVGDLLEIGITPPLNLVVAQVLVAEHDGNSATVFQD